MKAKYVFFTLIIFCLGSVFSMAQTGTACRKSTEGTDFWFGFMESRNYHSAHYVEVTLTSPFTCNYELRIGISNAVIYSGTLLPDEPRQIRLEDWNLVEATGSETVQEKAIHLTSDQPMNVYALNFDNNSSDVALIFPTSALGKEYFAICYEPHISETNQGAYGNGRNSEFLIVATEDNTEITIIPSKVTDQLRPADVPFSILLNKGEVYQVQSMNRKNSTGQGDLSGSNVLSDKPIAFFSGSLATTVPATSGVSAWDHLYEQIPPVQAWGNQFMAVPLKSRQKDTYRIFAAYDNTSVKVGNDIYLLVKKGDYEEFMLAYTDPRLVESTKPILLVQYSNSKSVDDAFTGGNGDPFMIIVSPLNQTKQNVTFVAYNSAQITDRYFVNVIAKDISTSFITLDQAPIQFTSLPNSGYSFAQIAIDQGNHQLQTSSEDKGFIAYVYGFGGVESYGYGVGFNLDIQLDLGGNLNNDTLVICKGTEVKLEAGAYFDNYLWSTGDTIPFITVSEERMYSVTATTIDGCIKSDSVYLLISDPVIDLGGDVVSCNPGETILDAGPGFKTYEWQDGSTSPTFTVMETGSYSVTATTFLGCKASGTVHVFVFDAQFTQDYTVATDAHSDISFFNHTEHAVSYLWDFGDGTTSEEENPVHHYNQVGEYKVLLQVISDSGCKETIGSQVRIIPFTIATPNAFRPESAIPENRIFLPILEGIDAEKYHFQVFSRLGSTVFETRNPELGWDGKFSDGSASGPGVFVWIVKFVDVQGFQHRQKGTVMLVR